MSMVFKLSSIRRSVSTERVPGYSLIPGGYDPDVNTMLLLKLDEGEGTQAVDYSDQGNHGDIQGPQWTWGKYGYGLELDGINDRVVVPHNPTLNLASDLCIEAWVNIAYRSTQRIVEKPDAYYLEVLKHGGGNDQIKFQGGIWAASTLYEIETIWFYNLEAWIHVAFQRNTNGYLSLGPC